MRTIAQPERLGLARLAGRHACCFPLDRAVPLGTGDAAALAALISAPRPPLGVLAATRVTATRIATLCMNPQRPRAICLRPIRSMDIDWPADSTPFNVGMHERIQHI